MNTDQISAEQEAIASLQKVYSALSECRRLHENAGMTLPPSLMSILGGNGNGSNPAAPIIPPIKREHMPPGVGMGWVSIAASAASPTSLTLAILREHTSPLRPVEVVEFVHRFLPDVPDGTIYNLGKRLAVEGIIDSGEEGWKLNVLEEAGILDGNYLWGHPDRLAKPDLAAHRREAILHVLRGETTGLQVVQIVEKLKRCSWVKAPVNKDLLKADVKILESEGMIRQRGNSRKWELTT